MKLILTISDPGQAKARSASRSLEKGSLTIGRAASADWMINDPERVLSKVHCRIEARSGRFILTDTSTNGVFVNGSHIPVGEGKTTILNDDDKLLLGGVTMTATIDTDSGGSRAPSIPPDDYSFVDMIGKAYAKGDGTGEASSPLPIGPLDDWVSPSIADSSPIQHHAFRPPQVRVPSKQAVIADAIPDDWLAAPSTDPATSESAASPAPRLAGDFLDGQNEGSVERRNRALVTGLASLAAGNASMRAALGCTVGFATPNSLLAASDAKTLQGALGSGNGAAIAEVLAGGLAHQSALLAGLRAAMEGLNGPAAMDFKTTLAATYRRVFETKTRQITGHKE